MLVLNATCSLLLRLYVFDGYVMKSSDKSKEPLDANNLLLRGSTLRKTPWAIGIAVNVGNEAKIMQNMTKVPRKVTQLERHMNVLVLLQFGVLLAMSAIMAGLDNWWSSAHLAREHYWYLLSTDQYPELPPGVSNFFVMVSSSWRVTVVGTVVMRCEAAVCMARQGWMGMVAAYGLVCHRVHLRLDMICNVAVSVLMLNLLENLH